MRRSLALAPLLALAAAAPAAAAPLAPSTLLDEAVTASSTTRAFCTDGLRAPGAAVLQRRVTMPVSGVVAARLTAASGDWDVAVVDQATGKVVTAGSGFGASEVASGFAGAGRTLVVQACRRSGTARTAQVKVTTVAVPVGAADQRAALVRVSVTSQAQKAMLGSMGFDLAEHAGPDFVDVLTTSDADRARLAKVGLPITVKVADLTRTDALIARRTRRAAQTRAAGDTVPSGRKEYRHLQDFDADMKRLVEQNPTLVRPITLPLKTLEGRTVQGIEIARDVNADDGRPVFMQMGVHHAREWPSAEHAMEWAFDLVGRASTDAKIKDLLGKVRTVVVPVVNPDGFSVSREAPTDLVNDPQYRPIVEQNPDTVPTVAYLIDPAINYKRRNCRLVPSQPAAAPGLCATPPFRLAGVDPNRNYGGFWGGPGASALPAYDTYRGEGPFSEPETRNVRAFISGRQVTTLITNHTFSGLVLRPPGIAAAGMPVDEAAMADLGTRMAARNGYVNQPSFKLYDTTGGTEDWSYYATGGYGYTFEIGPDIDPAMGGGFHPPFEFTVNQYNRGLNDGGGNRTAYLDAMENAADARQHSTLTGSVPAGVTLRLRKEFVTETSPVEPIQTDAPLSEGAPSPMGPKQTFDDVLDSTLKVPKGGDFTWSINPSTRPVLDSRSFLGSGKSSRTDEYGGDGGTAPGDSTDVPFTVTDADAAKILRITLEADLPADDYDIEVFRKDGDELTTVGTSGNSPGEAEEALIDAPKSGSYVLRVNNFAAIGPYSGVIERIGAGQVTIKPRIKTEQWTFTCEVGKTVVASQKIEIERGKALKVASPCGANAKAVVASVAGSSRGPGRAPKVCGSRAGFATASARAVTGGKGLRLAFTRRTANPVTIDVFQVSRGRSVLRERRVASFRGLTRTITWDGSAKDGRKISDGTFFVRFRTKGLRGLSDTRRFAFVRRGGAFRSQVSHYRPDSCGLLASAKLERPAFGGRTNVPLRIAYLVASRSDVTVVVRRAGKVVKTIRRPGSAGRQTQRVTVVSRGLPRGAYAVTITARSGAKTASATLLSRRL